MSSFQAQLTPDTYYPSMDSEGNYVDRIPFNFNVAQGFYCPCSSRTEKTCFNKKASLSRHFTTTNHEKWVASLNINKHNYFVENEEFKKIIESQKLQISEQSKIISKQNFKIKAQLDAIKSLNVMLDIYHKDTNNNIEPEPETVSNIDLIDFNFKIV
jgi:hypothetical protein